MRYRGKVFSAGENLDPEPSDAEAAEFVAKKYATREVVAAKVADKPAAPQAARGYQRRDMRPEQASALVVEQQESRVVGSMTSADMMGPKQE